MSTVHRDPNRQPEPRRPTASSVRDRLARDRTALANERTLLAYIRTALGFLVIGGPLVLVIDAPVGQSLGWTMIAGGGLVLGIGVHRFLQIRRRIEETDGGLDEA